MTLPATALDQLLIKLLAYNGAPLPARSYLNLKSGTGVPVDDPNFTVNGQIVGATDVFLDGTGASLWPFGPFNPTIVPPVLGAFSPLNFTKNGTQPAPPTFTSVGSGAGVEVYAPGGSGGFQGQEIAIPTPASSWTLTVGVTVSSSLWQYSYGGIHFRDSVSGKIAAFGLVADGAGAGNAARVIDVQYSFATVAGGLTSTPFKTNGAANNGVPLLMRFQYVASAHTLISYLSFNGQRFFQIWADSDSSGYGHVPDHVGLFCWADGTSGTSPTNDVSTLCWHWSLTQP